MKNLFDKWKTKIPKYSEEFEDNILEYFSKKGGGSLDKMKNYGKHFENNYELYIYAFFLGLYNNEFREISDTTKKKDFSWAIENWGKKGTKYDRKDFTILQEYIFTALIAKTDIDLIGLEKGEITEEAVIKQLLHTMQSYANGGFILIKEKLEDNKSYFFQPTSFLNMILGKPIEKQISKKKEVKEEEIEGFFEH